MSVFDTIRIAASGLTAERFRMDVAAANMANSRSTRSSAGGVYQPTAPVFEAMTMSPDGAQGVAAVGVTPIGGGPIKVYDPTHPDADANGFVSYPDVDAAAQMTDLMGASRSYAMNATVTQAAKQSALDAIELGALAVVAVGAVGGVSSILRATVDAVSGAGGAGAASAGITVGGGMTTPAGPAGGAGSVGSIGSTGSIGGIGATPDASSTGGSFLDSLSNALGELNTQVNGADTAMASFAAGGSADIHTVMLELQQASVGLKTGIAVRDKLLEAYQELMRIQV